MSYFDKRTVPSADDIIYVQPLNALNAPIKKNSGLHLLTPTSQTKTFKKINKGFIHKLVQIILVFVLALVISILSLHQGPAGLSFLLSQVVQMFQVVVVAQGTHNVDTEKPHRPMLPDSPLFQIPDVV